MTLKESEVEVREVKKDQPEIGLKKGPWEIVESLCERAESSPWLDSSTLAVIRGQAKREKDNKVLK